MHLRTKNTNRIRREIIKMSDTSRWRNPIAVTLTLRLRNKSSSAIASVNQIAASQNLRHFLNVLSRKTLGKKRVRRGERLKCIPIYEDKDVHPHFHLCMEMPETHTFEQFTIAINDAWQKTNFGYHEFDVQRCDTGWVSYINKYRTKSNYADSIDWMNFNNTDRAV